MSPHPAPPPLAEFTGAARGRFARAAWTIRRGECWAILGDDSTSKSILCAAIAGVAPPPPGSRLTVADDALESRRLLCFAQQSAAAQSRGFIQARYHSIESDFGPGDTVRDLLSFNRVFDVNPYEVGAKRTAERARHRTALKTVTRLLNLTALLPRDFLALSNGETRRVLFARAILAEPALLVLDDPCAGLDPARREQFKAVCAALAKRGATIVAALRHPDELPTCTTNVIEVTGGKLLHAALPPNAPANATPDRAAPDRAALPANPAAPLVVNIQNLNIRFGRRKLFENFTFRVARGERVLLRGENGSGKTTLLSLIIGDNPLAYANHTEVFGILRGPGADLNRVRKRIGLVSPELQAYTGLDPQKLLDSALRKKPELLLLDEPCMNLDARAAARLKNRVAKWLTAHPQATAICVAHRAEDVPPGFTREVVLAPPAAHQAQISAARPRGGA